MKSKRTTSSIIIVPLSDNSHSDSSG